MENVGLYEVVVAGMLGLLALVAATTLLVVWMFGVALAVVTPTMASVTVGVEHSRRRAWRRQVRASWLRDPHPAAPIASVDAEALRVRGPAVMCSDLEGVHLEFAAAEVASARAAAFTPSAIMHARLEPLARLELPANAGSAVAVYALAGRGAVGDQRRPLRAGQLAVHGPGSAVTLTGAPSRTAPVLDVLIVHQHPAGSSVARNSLTVLEVGTAVRQRLDDLRTLTADLPLPTPAGPRDVADSVSAA